jgi:ribosomal protein L9
VERNRKAREERNEKWRQGGRKQREERREREPNRDELKEAEEKLREQLLKCARLTQKHKALYSLVQGSMEEEESEKEPEELPVREFNFF